MKNTIIEWQKKKIYYEPCKISSRPRLQVRLGWDLYVIKIRKHAENE